MSEILGRNQLLLTEDREGNLYVEILKRDNRIMALKCCTLEDMVACVSNHFGKKMNSKEKLAQALQAYRNHVVKQLNNKENVDFTVEQMEILNTMIQRAKEGYYSDYDSPLTLPAVQLIRDLQEIGALTLVEVAKSGAFDATKEESDAWYKREGRQLALEVTGGNEEIADALFGETKEQTESKEGIKW